MEKSCRGSQCKRRKAIYGTPADTAACRHRSFAQGSDKGRWHVHAQGTSCPEFDRAEAAAIAKVLDGQREIPVTAAQALFGNLGAGGAAVQLICSLLALEKQSLFAIKNLKDPIPQAAWRPAEQAEPAGEGFLHSSFTLQGQVSCLAVRSLA